jgi:heat shock protein HtpX
MFLLLTVLFAIIYSVIVMVGTAMGIGNFYFYLFISVLMMIGQYLIGPKIVEWSMRVKYVSRKEYPSLYSMVEEMARKANMPMPKIGVSPEALPNAFAFGRGKNDGRVCVTEGILRLLKPDEIRAVLGHELAHIRNRDVLTITILSVIPMILYRIAWHFMFYGGSRRERGGSNAAIIGLAAFLFYFITNLLVLYASRIREYYADRGSLDLGNKPSSLATALYKLVYGSARMSREAIKESEGLKAFFLNDLSHALTEIKELRQLDLDKSGTIDSSELLSLRGKTVQLSFVDKLMETLSTHPNMLKRIQHLAKGAV